MAPLGAGGPVARRLSARMVARRHRRGRDARGLCDPGFARLCGTGRPAAAGRRLRISARRARLRAVRLLAPARDRSDIGHLAHDRRDRGNDGGRRCAPLCADRQPRGFHGRGPCLDRLGPAAQRAREADQQQHPGRFQGRRRDDHRDDPDPEPDWACRAAVTISSSAPCCWRASSRRRNMHRAGDRPGGDRAVVGRRSACFPASRSRSRVVALSILAASVFGLPALGVPITGEIPAGLPSLAGPALRVRDVEGIVPLAAGCLLLAYIEGVSAGARLCGQARLCDRPPAGAARSRRRQSVGGPWPGLPGSGRAVAIGGQRQGRRPHAARARLRLRDAGLVPALPHRPAGDAAESGARRRGADRGAAGCSTFALSFACGG